ncbi:MAG: hypothetical protein CML68_11500 [Rhodobacteraceae bacterium]|nr:hypothetical protein [Paracoccaceae bacterium]
MSKSTADGPKVTLGAATYGFVLASLLVLAATAAAVFLARSETVVDEALDLAVRARTSAAGEGFARLLHADWIDLKYLADATGDTDAEGIRNLMDGMRGDGTRISWIGYADASGTVRAAADGLLVGADVGQRPWFRNGLKSGFAGDVHDAVLLAQKLQPDGGDPLRFIDLALPVRNPAGDVVGVVGMHIDAGWAERTLAESGRMLGIELYLIDQAGSVVMTSGGDLPGAGEERLLAAARAGTETSGRAIWPDGKAYFTALVPTVSYADLPSFGWRLAGRINAEAFRPGLSSLLGSAAYAIGIALVILAVMTLLFVRIFVGPITRLASDAEAFSLGRDSYPPELQSTREAAQLSTALARLQARRSPRSGP